MPTFPLSSFRKIGNLYFVSGQIGQQNGSLVAENITEQTTQAIQNIQNVLEQQGLNLQDVKDVTAFLVDQADYEAFNEAYRLGFSEPFPSRTTVTVQSLPLNAKVELKAIASKE